MLLNNYISCVSALKSAPTSAQYLGAHFKAVILQLSQASYLFLRKSIWMSSIYIISLCGLILKSCG